MELLKTKNEPGFFDYKFLYEKAYLFISHGYYPTLQEFWDYAVSLIPPSIEHNIHFKVNAYGEFKGRVYQPAIQEALTRLCIEKTSKEFSVQKSSNETDRESKVDLIVNSITRKNLIIIQIKSTKPKFNDNKIYHKELQYQIQDFGIAAEYLVVTFEEESFLELEPQFEFEYCKSNGTKIVYKKDQVDKMLEEMEREQFLKRWGKLKYDTRR